MDETFKEAIKDANLPEFDFDKAQASLKQASLQDIQHSWHQEGPTLVCGSCPHKHSQWIGPLKRLTGFDDRGRPQIEDVD